jgi:hypothetical protein
MKEASLMAETPFTFVFQENDDSATVILVNDELSRWTKIEKVKVENNYNVTITYGDIGKGKDPYKGCKLPRFASRTDNTDVTGHANHSIMDKLTSGYVYQRVTVNGQNIYQRS